MVMSKTFTAVSYEHETWRKCHSKSTYFTKALVASAAHDLRLVVRMTLDLGQAVLEEASRLVTV